MLSDIKVTPTIGVKDIETAKRFYEKTLGLQPLDSDEDVLHFKVGNGEIEVYKSDFAGTNKATSMTWGVGDKIEEEVKSLRDKGVEFEHYEMPETRLEGDIHIMNDMKIAWFKDPDGNIICLHNH